MKDYNKMFMRIAEITAIQSNCIKYQAGCVIVKDNRIILQGYNGTPSGVKNCNDKFDINNYNREKHNLWSNAIEVHAEMNCITYAAKKGISLENTIMYVTHKPCNNCLKHILSTGIKEIIYKNDYIDNNNILDIELFNKLITIKQF